MPSIKNITSGPKGLNGPDGLIYLEAGEEADVTLADGEYKASKRTGWFEMADQEIEDTSGDLDREDLKAQADELGITYARNIPTPKLKELIDAKLAEPPAPAADTTITATDGANQTGEGSSQSEAQ